MGEFLHQLRRSAMLTGTRAALAATGALPNGGLSALGHLFGAAAGATIPLRRRLLNNYRAAFGTRDVPRSAVSGYFRLMRLWAGTMLRVYHRGLKRAGVVDRFVFDDSLQLLDDAVGYGRGVVLAVPHYFLYDVAGGVIGLRHPVVALVRDQRSASKQRLKRRWYESVGMATVWRPRHASVVADMKACLDVLRRGQVLGITPDLPMRADRGVRVRLFGRHVNLMPGAVALPMQRRCPVLTIRPAVLDDGTVRLSFIPQELPPRTAAARDAAVAEALQRWCHAFEAHLREYPWHWFFWLDKRWTRVLRTPAIEKDDDG